MYHAYPKQSLGLDLNLDLSGAAATITNYIVAGLKPKLPEIVKSATDEAIKAMKPRIPELVQALLPQVPVILKAAEKPLENYLLQRLYPKVIRPLAEKELFVLSQAAKKTAITTAIVGGGIVVAGILGFSALRKLQRK